MSDQPSIQQIIRCPACVYGKNDSNGSSDDFKCLFCHCRFSDADLQQTLKKLGTFSWRASGAYSTYPPVISWQKLNNGSFLVVIYEDTGVDANNRPHTLRQIILLVEKEASGAITALLHSLDSLQLDESKQLGEIRYDADACTMLASQGIQGDVDTFLLHKSDAHFTNVSTVNRAPLPSAYHECSERETPVQKSSSSSSSYSSPIWHKRGVSILTLVFFLGIVALGIFVIWRQYQDACQLKENLKSLEMQLEDSLHKNQQANKENRKLCMQNDTLKIELTKAQQQINTLSKEKANLQKTLLQTHDQCKEDLINCKTNLDRLKSHYKKVQLEFKSLTKELDVMTQRLKNFEKKLQPPVQR